ncbi:DUF1707 SHOCT-like domain-containing protein [Streptomyces glomeratus]|uniref:DUF1707 domain-containing protein n=1 Tax=Streptomyces glomeratus TaxID=284452 RepID=A0ABP6L1T5_9ACTN|nr:DUF1707 domain-containing protein [Streptomyces glomeratus]MCF1509568.1 DUF1707 domain-containing protein [Streptomyces glomeratus]
MAASHHRIGDQEREAAARQLGEHFASGRLTKGQLDERLAVALTAETAPALDEVLRDLPEPSDPSSGRQRRGRWAAVTARLKARRGRRALALTLAAWAAGGALFGADWLLSWPGRLLLVGGIAVALLGGRPHRTGHDGRPGRVRGGPGGHIPGGGGSMGHGGPFGHGGAGLGRGGGRGRGGRGHASNPRLPSV